MNELEKVIAGLESCRPGRNCGTCPYHEFFDKGICNRRLEDDALVLLKAQMPRVMTWDEVREFSKISDYEFSEKTPCYIEFKSPDPCYVKWIDAEKMFQWLSVSLERRQRCYNNDVRFGWRCWTSRPSPEQMESTPWKGEKDHEA